MCASHLGRKLADSVGCETDRAGRVVEPDFSVAGHPEIRVVGDLCSYKHTRDGKPLPGMAGPATQAGFVAAIVAGTAAHSWFDFGGVAVLDRIDAVADLQGLKFKAASGGCWAAAHWPSCPPGKTA